MSVFPGDAVVLNTPRTSRAGGQVRSFDEGMVGRVCKVSSTGSGLCCVQFANQCLKVREDFLSPTTRQAPACSARCRTGC